MSRADPDDPAHLLSRHAWQPGAQHERSVLPESLLGEMGGFMYPGMSLNPGVRQDGPAPHTRQDRSLSGPATVPASLR